jgi:hypothetical protein
MAESVLDADLDAMLESVLIRDDKYPSSDIQATRNKRADDAVFPRSDYEVIPAITRKKSEIVMPRDLDFQKRKSIGQQPAGNIEGLGPRPLTQRNMNEPYGMRTDPETGRVRMTIPPPKRSDMPNQSEFPLPSERETRVSGPRSLKVDGEPTGTEREVDEEMADLDEQGSGSPNPYPVGQDALSPQQKLNPTNNPNKSIVQGIKDFIMNPLKPGM